MRQLAGARKEAFIASPTRRNRLWQADFSEYETAAAGTPNLGGVVNHFAEVALAGEVSVRKTTTDAIGFLETALDEVEALLGVSLVEDLTDPATGEIAKLRLVTDNGPCFKSARFASWVAAKRHIVHIRTRRKAPWTNGVIERFFESLKYEHPYRKEIGDRAELATQINTYRTIYNSTRPHQAIGMARPLEIYRKTPEPNPPTDESVSNS